MSLTGGTESMSYKSIKYAAKARELEREKDETLNRSILCLIADFLQSSGYTNSLSSLKSETGNALNNFAVADNINLSFVIQEYEAFQNVKLGRAPKLIRHLTEPPKSKNEKAKSYASLQRHRYGDKPPPGSSQVKNRNDSNSSLSETSRPQSNTGRNILPKIQAAKKEKTTLGDQFISMEGTKITTKSQSVSQTNNQVTANKPKQIVDVRSLLHNAIQSATNEALGNPQNTSDGVATCPEEKLLKPLGSFEMMSNESRSLAATISQEIYVQNPNVKFSDIIGLEKAKKFVKESVVYPIKYPQLFSSSKLLSPWKGLLLYGPPGTGKTMLAKAVATNCNTTFFNISASSIVSKWRGDSEKLVRVLFELARHHAPSTIFIDEIDSIMSTRDASDHEGSKRMKTELLIQMDGLNALDQVNNNVFVLAASNMPWNLDVALLRRLEKRIFVDLPGNEARESLFKHYLRDINTEATENCSLSLSPDINFSKLAELTNNYSGADIYQICKESAMSTLRKIFDILEQIEESPENAKMLENLKLEPVTQELIEVTVRNTKAATIENKRYEKWASSFDTR